MNRGAEFDALYVFPPLLEACCRSHRPALQAQFVSRADTAAGSPAQELHVTCGAIPPIGHSSAFILMVDEFRPTTRHPLRAGLAPLVSGTPENTLQISDRTQGQVAGVRQPASLLIFTGPRGTATSKQLGGPRRSLKCVHSAGRTAAPDFAARMLPRDPRATQPARSIVLAL